MERFFIFLTIGIILVTLLALVRVFRGPDVYNRFIGIMVMGNNVVLILVLIGFIHGRRDMYVDIAVSYAVLGFISSVIVAKFLGTKGD